MGSTTKANVLLIAPELSSITDNDVWDIVLADVASEVSLSVFGTMQERAQRYLAAHYLSLYGASLGAATGSLKRDKVGNTEKEYAVSSTVSASESDYGRTKYGRTYLSIRNKKILGFVAFTP